MKTYDLAIVGGGPAGLSAAINGASEGLDVVLIDANAHLGGQAKESSAIENYPLPLGSQMGVTGAQLMEGFVAQARKFECELFSQLRIERLIDEGGTKRLVADDHHEVRAKTVILSPGLRYRRHKAEGLDRLARRGVYYGMPPVWPRSDCTVVVVGGANSAGQAIMRLATFPRVKIKVLCRRPLAETMSAYLIERIEETADYGTPDAKIEVLCGGELLSAQGKDRLQQITYRRHGVEKSMRADMMLFYIGAVPNTAWLSGVVGLDDKNFIMTGRRAGWTEDEHQFQTTIENVFSMGDVRCGSVKRIVNATGEGGAGLQAIHEALRTL